MTIKSTIKNIIKGINPNTIIDITIGKYMNKIET